MTYEKKWVVTVIIISLLSIMQLLILAYDREVIYNDRGFPVIMQDGKPLMPEDMR